MSRKTAAAAVFLASFALFCLGAGSSGLATAWVDPVARIQAQDEAVYAAVSLEMATGGTAAGDGWLTPHFLGRLALFKPPLLYWASAVSAKLFGFIPLALRIPTMLAGAGTITIVFLWTAEQGSLLAGIAGALLAFSSHLMFVLSRVAMTDSLLTFELLLAVWMLARDPRLARSSSLWTFGVASGAAILTKGVAGALPILVLGVLCVRRDRPAWSRIVQALGIAALVAAPWHVYQLARHPHWFWAEYVMTEHLTWGLTAPGQTTPESQAGFYLKRLLWLDPVLVIVGLIGAIRARSPAVWALLGVIAAAVLAFQYRNAAYLMPIYPALAIAAGLLLRPQARPRARSALLFVGAAVALFVGKALAPDQPWGLPFAPEFVNPSYTQLAAYDQEHRGNELILPEPDDQFYSATLRLPQVRYVYIDPGAGDTRRPKLPLDFEQLGVTVTAEQFARLAELLPVFAQRLQAFDLDSMAPVATVILARDDEEMGTLITSHPEMDFYLPARWAALDRGTHERREGAAGRVWLRSRVVIQRPGTTPQTGVGTDRPR